MCSMKSSVKLSPNQHQGPTWSAMRLYSTITVSHHTVPLTIWRVGLQLTGYVFSPVCPCIFEGGWNVRVPHSVPSSRLWIAEAEFLSGWHLAKHTISETVLFHSEDTFLDPNLSLIQMQFIPPCSSALCMLIYFFFAHVCLAFLSWFSSWLCSYSGLMLSKSSLKLCRHPTACLCVLC